MLLWYCAVARSGSPRLVYLFAGAILAAQDLKRDTVSEPLARLGLEAEVCFIEPQLPPTLPATPVQLRPSCGVRPYRLV